MLLSATLAALFLAPAPPASAAESDPVLTSASLSSGPVHAVGQSVAVDFTLSEAAHSVRFVYLDESTVTTQTLRWDGTPGSGPLSATATSIIGDGYYAGQHALLRVEIDHAGGTVHYARDREVLDFEVDTTAPALGTNTMLAEPTVIGVPIEGFTIAVDPGRWTESEPEFTVEWGGTTGPASTWTAFLGASHVGMPISPILRWAKTGFRPVEVLPDPAGPVEPARPWRVLGQAAHGSILRVFDLGLVLTPPGVTAQAAHHLFPWKPSPLPAPSGPTLRAIQAVHLDVILAVKVGSRVLRGPWVGWHIVGYIGSSHHSSGFNADGTPDLMARDPSGRLRLYPTGGDGTWGSVLDIGEGWNGYTPFQAGDFDGDGRNDVMARDSSGRLFLYPGDGNGGWLPRSQVGQGWDVFDHVITPGTFTGDHVPDLLARTPSGDLILYNGLDYRGPFFKEPQRVGTGWDVMDAIFSPGDFDGDYQDDVLARDRSGTLHLYSGDGAGGWLGQRAVGWGWDVMASIGSAGDFNGDGHADVWAIDRSGQFHVYYGDSRGGWQGANTVGWGWGAFTAVF